MHTQDSELLLQSVKELIAIESTANNPLKLQEALEFVASFIRAKVPDITIEHFERNDKPSFLAYKGNSRPKQFHIILNGHVDVVPGAPEQYDAKIEDDKLYGRGANDMKAAVIVLADMFCEFVEKVPYPLGLQIVTDEESAGHDGTMYQVEQGVRSDFVLCGDCGRTTTSHVIANEAKGMVSARIAFKGRSTHGAYPWNGDNAALRAAHFVGKLHERYPVPAEATGETTITVTSIVTAPGGMTQVPDHATAVLDARYSSGDPNFTTKEDFKALIATIDPQAEIIEFMDFSAPMYTRPDDPVLLQLKSAAEKTEGMPFSFVKNNGTADGRHFGVVGNAACEFGIAGEGQHSPEEYITLAAFHMYHNTLRVFLQDTMKVPTKP